MSVIQVSNDKSQEKAAQSRNLNIFEDPAIAAAAQNDPFARWVSKNWRSIGIVLLAIAAGVLAYTRFTSLQNGKRAEATQIIAGIQETYSALVAEQESLLSAREEEAAVKEAEKKVELKKKIDTSLAEVSKLQDKLALQIDSLDSSRPYDIIGNLYRGLLALQRKDYAKVQSIVAAQSWEQSGKPESAERFLAELLTLALTRGLVDSDTHREFAREQLATLAERGSVAAVQSYVAFSLIADTEAQRKQMQELNAKLRLKFPGQQKALEEGIDGDA